MTKKLLPLLFSFLSCTLFSQTLIPDVNFEQFLVDQGIDTNGITGDILNADAQAVTALNVTRNDITDFTGLEAFVNVTILNLGNNLFMDLPLNNLTALEELVFNQNTVLANLDLSTNINLRKIDMRANGGVNTASINTIDFSANINIEDIHIYNFGDLQNFILPNTTTLTNLYIYSRHNLSVDLTVFDNLESLYLGVGASSAINVTMPAVKNILKSVDFYGGNIANIDLSEYIALESIRLTGTNVVNFIPPPTPTLTNIYILIHSISSPLSLTTVSNLQSLTIANNSTAIPLEVDLTNNLVLENLNLSNNKMINIDITQNTQLTDVNLSNNQLITIETNQNVVLEDLNASQNNITSLDLSQNIALDNLNLRDNELPILNLSTNINLRRVNLGINLLPNLDITTNTEITNLYIDNNLFTGTGLDLTQNVNLRELNAENNQIESLDITQNLALTDIILNHNLFPGTAILDQFYTIRAGDGGIRGGTLEVSHNLLTGQIPNFADLFLLGPADSDPWTRRFELTIDNNNFHFGDLENDHLDFISYLNMPGGYGIPVLSIYNYAPQQKVNAVENPNPNAGESITLLTDVRGEQNHYKWFKDGVEITDAPDSPELVLTDLDICDEGVYYSEITSDLVPFENANAPGTNGKNLLLVRNDITLTVNATKNCVTMANPIDGATNIPINTGIEWNDNPGACGYKITVINVDAGTPIQYNGNPITGLDVGDITLFNFDSDLPPDTKISVQITPYFDDGDFGGCTTESFTTNASAIATECTTLIDYPRNNDTDVPSDFASISWNPANAADGYKLTITSTSGVNNLPETNIGNTLTYSFGQEFQAGDVVEISITPTNSTFGDANSCSTESFTIASETVTPTPPNCTTLLNPSNTDTDVAVDLAQISWNAVANATQYRISVNGSTSDLNDVTDLMVTGTSHPFTNNFDNGETVTVTIVPLNGTVEPTTTCSAETFTIETAAPTITPTCTSLTSPIGTNVSIGTTQMTWDAVTDATGYRINITGTANNNVTDIEITGTSYDFNGPFVNGETATVTIIPFNGPENATGCTPETFTIESVPDISMVPDCTSLTTPNNGAINVELSTSISWEESSNAEGYRLTIGTTSGGNDVVDNEDVSILTSYTFMEDLMPATTYFVSITPYNSFGNAVDCEKYTFTTIAEDQTLYGFSPNGDGINDFWNIDGIEASPDNTVFIYNRWGDLVFQIQGYDNQSNVFSGTANNKTQMGASELPSGTYFFNIQVSGEHNLNKLQGYLVLKR